MIRGTAGVEGNSGKLTLKLHFALITAPCVIHHYLSGATAPMAADQVGNIMPGQTLTAQPGSKTYDGTALAADEEETAYDELVVGTTTAMTGRFFTDCGATTHRILMCVPCCTATTWWKGKATRASLALMSLRSAALQAAGMKMETEHTPSLYDYTAGAEVSRAQAIIGAYLSDAPVVEEEEMGDDEFEFIECFSNHIKASPIHAGPGMRL